MCNIMGKSACEEQAVQLTMQLLRARVLQGTQLLGLGNVWCPAEKAKQLTW